jgi:hypothetical protein
VIYFFNLPGFQNTEAMALIKLFSLVHPYWWEESNHVYCVVEAGTEDDLMIIPVRDVSLLVAAVPDPQRGPTIWCIVRKPCNSALITENLDENEEDDEEYDNVDMQYGDDQY